MDKSIFVSIHYQVGVQDVEPKEELAADIKYKIERKISLEQQVRVGNEAREELAELEDKLRENMLEYLGLITRE